MEREFSSSKRAKSVDDILKLINPFGRYQWLTAFIYIYAYSPLVMNNLFMSYGGLEPEWVCTDQWTNNSSPTEDCAIYERCSPENLTFVSDFFSVVNEWSLVCDREYFASLITTIQMIGQLVGAVITGPVSDLYGRKWTFVVVLCLEFSIGSLSALSTSAAVFVAFRFLIGVCTGAEMVIAWVYTAESTTNRYRLIIRILAAVLASYWNQLLIAYFSGTWKLYSIIGNAEGVPILIVLIFFAYESPRWLAQKGRTREATRILREIARINKTSHLLPDNIELGTESKAGARKYHVWHLFSSRRLAIYTAICALNWFAASMAYYGMFFNTGHLGPNVYLSNTIVAGMLMLEIPVGLYDMYSARANRKYMMIAFFALAAVCDVFICLFQTVASTIDPTGILLILSSSVGQVATGCAFDLCYIYAVELFPTLLRSNANAVMSVGARIGGVIAPQLLFAGKTWSPLPYVCFGVISVVVAGLDALFLPDTKKMHLPETLQQANHLSIDQENFAYEQESDEIAEKNDKTGMQKF